MKPTHPRKLKSRIMWADPIGNCNASRTKEHWATVPVLVTPLPSRQSARALKKFLDMGEAERVEAMAKALSGVHPIWLRADLARDIHRAIFGPPI